MTDDTAMKRVALIDALTGGNPSITHAHPHWHRWLGTDGGTVARHGHTHTHAGVGSTRAWYFGHDETPHDDHDHEHDEPVPATAGPG